MLLAGFATLAAGACSPTVMPDGGGARCVPGMTIACACLGGRRGAQTCRPDGTYGACDCAIPVDAADDGAADAADAVSPRMDAFSAGDSALPDADRDAAPDAADGAGSRGPPVWDGTLPTNGVCSLDGWCWRSPVLGWTSLFSVWGSSATDVWATGEPSSTGEDGAVLHWDGTRWTGIVGLRTPRIGRVSGSGPADVWITSGTDFLHWDGTRWSSVRSDSTEMLSSIWVRAADDAWAVGAHGIILHWNGTTWAPSPSGSVLSLNAVFARAVDDAWAVGMDRTVLHWDGTRWSERTAGLPAAGSVTAVWAATSNDAWIIVDATVYRWNGTTWTTTLTSANRYTFISGTSSSDILVGGAGGSSGAHWDGTSWSYAYGGCSGGAAWPAAPADYFVVSSLYGFSAGPSASCTAARVRIGTREVQFNTFPFGDLDPIEVESVARDDILVRDAAGTWFRGDGRRPFTAMPPLPSATDAVRAFLGGDIWSFGSSVVAHWDGSNWVRTTPAATTTVRPTAIWANTPRDVWIVDNSGAAHWDGTTWATTLPPPGGTSYGAVWGIGPRTVWAAGRVGVAHYDGSAWTAYPGSETFSGLSLWGRSESEVYAAGSYGGVFGWDGARWNELMSAGYPFPGTVALRKFVWLDGPELWAVDSQHVGRWIAGSWRESPIGWPLSMPAGSVSISGRASDDLWMISGGRTMLHRGP